MASRRADDHAVAGVVGFVLIVAVAISYYAYVAQAQVPRWGLENEQEWDDIVGTAMLRITREGQTNLGAQLPVTGVVPRQPEPQKFDVPLVGATQPVPASATVSFDSICTPIAMDVLGSTSGSQTLTSGCLRFDSHPVYSQPYSYVVEHGALIRVQGENAYMMAGPPLKVRLITSDTGDLHEVVLGLVTMSGPGSSTSLDSSNAAVDLIAGATHTEAAQGANAQGVELSIGTHYPKAWKGWLDGRLRGAGFDASTYAVTVEPLPASLCTALVGASGNINECPASYVKVLLNGPASDTRLDMIYTLTQGSYSVSLR